MKKGLPAFSAFLIFVVVVGINTFANIFSYNKRWDFEIISNVAMISVALISFWGRKNFPPDGCKGDLGDVLANVAISVIAILMNIFVFEHFIRREQLLSDLWGWHLFWIFCAIGQLLILSGAWKNLLGKILALLSWGMNIVSQLGRISNDLLNAFQNCKKSVVLTVFAGIAGLALDIGIQIYINGTVAVFSDMNVFWERIFRWIMFIVIILFLIHTIPLALQKVIDTIRSISGKMVLTVVVVIILVSLTGVIPFLLETIAFIVMIPVIAVTALGFVIGRIRRIVNSIYEREETAENMEAEKSATKDWIIILLAYIGIPLLFLCIITVSMPSGKQIVTTQDPSELTTWLNFISEALEVAKSLLELFSI